MGHISTAPILFLGSNPSIGIGEKFPTLDWDDSQIVSFFERRFDADAEWLRDLRPLQPDGGYGKPIRFYANTRKRAEELLGRRAILGADLAFAEIVHCKSRGEVGVAEAAPECSERYLEAVLALSAAKVIVVLGNPARETLNNLIPATRSDGRLVGPLLLGGRPRFVAYLPHPASWAKAKTFAGVMPKELIILREALRGS